METNKKKSKLVFIVLIMIILVLSLTGTVLAGGNHNPKKRYPMGDHSDGAIVWGPTKAEVFKYFADMNWDGIPTWLFAEYNISLWCAQKGAGISEYLTVTEEHYWAWEQQTETYTNLLLYSKVSPLEEAL